MKYRNQTEEIKALVEFLLILSSPATVINHVYGIGKPSEEMPEYVMSRTEGWKHDYPIIRKSDRIDTILLKNIDSLFNDLKSRPLQFWKRYAISEDWANIRVQAKIFLQKLGFGELQFMHKANRRYTKEQIIEETEYHFIIERNHTMEDLQIMCEMEGIDFDLYFNQKKWWQFWK